MAFDIKDSVNSVKDRFTSVLTEHRRTKELLARSKPLRRSPLLKAIGGRHDLVFHSDYMEIDNRVAQILTVIDREGADRNFMPFWMLYLIPRKLGEHVQARFMLPVTTMTEKWTNSAQSKSETVKRSQDAQATESDASKFQQQASNRAQDLALIAGDLNAGDKYLGTQLKIFLKASDLNALDGARLRLEQALVNYGFGGVRVVPFEGQQRDDYSELLKPADQHFSKMQMFTSYELAGGYHLLSHGIVDPAGEYVGISQADINQSGVLLDVDNFSDSVVVASKDAAQTRTLSKEDLMGNRNSTLWGVKIAQSALINGHRVVHFVLNHSDPEHIGVDLSNSSVDVQMDHGAINPFELFGQRKEQLGIFSAHSSKLRLMAMQVSPSLANDDRTLNKTLGDIVQNFYIKNGMWDPNPKENQSRLRVVGLPHDQYPRLRDFNMYLSSALDMASRNHKYATVKSIEALQGVFDRLQNEDSDLFDVYTDNTVSYAQSAPQAFYDFSKIMDRNSDIGMAQVVNAIGYATDALRERDVFIIHGADLLTESVKKYLTKFIFRRLKRRGVRLVFLYDSVDECLNDADFCDIRHADYTLFGTMTGKNIKDYQQIIDEPLPDALSSAIKTKIPTLFFLSRGMDKVIFIQDLVLE